MGQDMTLIENGIEYYYTARGEKKEKKYIEEEIIPLPIVSDKENLKMVENEKIFNTEIKVIKYIENIELIESLSQLPNACGTYILNTVDGKYIGSSKNVRHRIYNHIKKKLISASIYLTESHTDAVILEYILIKQLRPELNKHGNNSNKIYNIDNDNNGKRYYRGRHYYDEFTEEDEHYIPTHLIKENRFIFGKSRTCKLNGKKIIEVYDDEKKVYIPYSELFQEEHRLENEFIDTYIINEKENIKNWLTQTKPEIFYNERGQFRQKILISDKIRTCKIVNRKIYEVYDDEKKVYVPYEEFLRQRGEYIIHPIE